MPVCKDIVMKKIKIIAILLLAISGIVAAQPPDDDKGPLRDWVNTKRVGFFTTKLNLTTSEAEKFWPVYNLYAKEIGDLKHRRKKNSRDAFDRLAVLEDSEIEKEINEEFEFRQEELNITKKYVAEFKTVLPMKKVALLLKAEEEFKIWILKEWKNHGLGPPGRGGMDDAPPGSPR